MDEWEYNLWDIHATALSARKLVAEGGADASRFDMALYGPALTMSLRGLRVDERAAAEVLEETWDEARAHRKALDAIRKFTWNPRTIKPSPHELKRILFDELRAPLQLNRDGGRTTNTEALDKILNHAKSSEEAAEVARIALELSRLEEDRKVIEKPRGRDGRMHTGLGVATTVTSRWSSRRDAFGDGANLHALSRRVRRIFIADPGFVLVNRDLDQAESYCVAWLSGCRRYRELHERGNVHLAVGGMLWPEVDGSTAKVTAVPWNPDMMWYDLFKRRQHSGNYGQTPHGFSRIAHLPLAVAKRSHALYFGEFPEIKAWHAEVRYQLQTFKKLTTPMGRIRQFVGRTWDDSTLKEAIAHVPQSTISDVNKIILARLWRELDPWLYQCLLEVHDSNLGQVREEDVAEYLERSAPLARVEVPIGDGVMVIGSSVEVGRNWGKGGADNPGGLVDAKKWIERAVPMTPPPPPPIVVGGRLVAGRGGR